MSFVTKPSFYPQTTLKWTILKHNEPYKTINELYQVSFLFKHVSFAPKGLSDRILFNEEH